MAAMIHCDGCGFNVEPEDVRRKAEFNSETNCDTCRECEATPKLREAYRRGFNAGLDRLTDAVVNIVKSSGLRKRATSGNGEDVK